MKNQELFLKLRNIFIEEDPIGIYFPDAKNIDEYDQEIEILLSKINQLNSYENTLNAIQEIFIEKFGNEYSESEKYSKLARRVFEIL